MDNDANLLCASGRATGSEAGPASAHSPHWLQQLLVLLPTQSLILLSRKDRNLEPVCRFIINNRTGLLKQFRGLLNKVTRRNFHVIGKKMDELVIDSEYQMEQVLTLIFERAVSEPKFCNLYARLCLLLGMRNITTHVVKHGQVVREKTEFRKVLIQKCQREFERDIYEGIDFDGKQKDISDCRNKVKRLFLEQQLDEDKRRARH